MLNISVLLNAYKFSLKVVILFIAIMIYIPVSGQNQEDSQSIERKKKYLTRAGLNRLLNKSFANLTTGNSSSTLMNNYASLDPAQGSFSFKGTIPIGVDTGTMSFLSLRLSGDLVSDSYAALFSNSTINTNTSIRAEYYLRLPLLSKAGIRYFSSDRAGIDIKRSLIEQEQVRQKEKIKLNLVYLEDQKHRITERKKLIETDISNQETSYQNMKKVLETFEQLNEKDSIKKALDSLDKLEAKIIKSRLSHIDLKSQMDSIQKLIEHKEDWKDYQNIILSNETLKRIAELEMTAPTTFERYNWITFIGATGKKKFYTYTPAADFADQIQDHKLQTFSFGFALNHFRKNNFKKRSSYFNIGVLRVRDNNTNFLSTKEVNQEVEVSRNDTTRTISKKYNAFTDPIVENKQWTLFTNAYYLFNSNSGLHVFPSLEIRDDGKTLSHLGFGYAMTFLNNKKDQPVINLEGYIQFIDLFDKLNAQSRFWNRNEIGVRFTLPFNFYSQQLNIPTNGNKF